jgi:lysozyme
MTTRQINGAGVMLIQNAEGLRLTAYKDPSGIWTIGYGHVGGVYKGDTIAAIEATALLYQDLMIAEDWVTARTEPSSDNQFAAMVSLTFNIGTQGFLGSSVRRLHNAGEFPAAAGAFLLWDKAHINGQLVTLPGLLNRRRAEETLYLT